jgi:hypothetical protein
VFLVCDHNNNGSCLNWYYKSHAFYFMHVGFWCIAIFLDSNTCTSDEGTPCRWFNIAGVLSSWGHFNNKMTKWFSKNAVLTSHGCPLIGGTTVYQIHSLAHSTACYLEWCLLCSINLLIETVFAVHAFAKKNWFMSLLHCKWNFIYYIFL